MASSSWNDPALTKTAASLNEELERIFEQVEKAVRKAGPVSEESLPRLEILPDDFDPAETPPNPTERGGQAALKPAGAPSFPSKAGSGAPGPRPPVRAPRPSQLEFAAIEDEPAREILSGDFDLAVGRISPAGAHEDGHLMGDFLSDDFDLAVARISPADHSEPEMPELGLDDQPTVGWPGSGHTVPHSRPVRAPEVWPSDASAGDREAAGAPLRLEPDAFRLSGAEAKKIAEAASALAPDELARLIERAVEKGVLAALKKWER